MVEAKKISGEVPIETEELRIEPSLLPTGITRTAHEISRALIEASPHSRSDGYLDVLETARQWICKYNSSWKDNPFLTPLLETRYDEAELPRFTSMALSASRETATPLTKYATMLATFRLLELQEIDKLPIPGVKQNTYQMVAELSSNGLDRSTESIGYHGTTIEALIHMFQHGVLPGTTHTEEDDTESEKQLKGDLYFAPIDFCVAKNDNERLKAAMFYAGDRAPDHYVRKYLGHDLSIKGSTRGLLYDGYSGYSSAKLSALGSRASLRSGFLITLNKRVAKDFWMRRGDDEDSQDSRIHCATGLPIEYVTGIKPLGTDEVKFLRDLKAA